MQISDNIHADPAANLRLALKEKRYDDMAAIMKANDLRLENGRIVANEKDRKTCSDRSAYWKMMQQIRKILLNSLYGALLNKHCRFYDKRLGQSVTLTGRSITKHMASTINETLTGLS